MIFNFGEPSFANVLFVCTHTCMYTNLLPFSCAVLSVVLSPRICVTDRQPYDDRKIVFNIVSNTGGV